MQTHPISDLFVDGGLIVSPSRPGETIADLDRDEILSLFERHGALLFRGFALHTTEMSVHTDRFTEEYARDAVRRKNRFEEKHVRDVDTGNDLVPLHCEASFAPVWPEIIWFYCNVPSTTGGATTLCDGLRLWSRLPAPLQTKFLAQPVKYDLLLPMNRKIPAAGRVPWPFLSPGVTGYVDRGDGVAVLTVLRYAVQESRLPAALCFANHLQARSESLVKSITMADGSPITDAVYGEIENAANPLTFDLAWRAQDLVMLDNRRFLHGRRKFGAGDPRDIVQVQTARANFAFGATTRKRLRAVDS